MIKYSLNFSLSHTHTRTNKCIHLSRRHTHTCTRILSEDKQHDQTMEAKAGTIEATEVHDSKTHMYQKI